jgi:hypothetical protein
MMPGRLRRRHAKFGVLLATRMRIGIGPQREHVGRELFQCESPRPGREPGRGPFEQSADQE